jgi:hypothetical protein
VVKKKCSDHYIKSLLFEFIRKDVDCLILYIEIERRVSRCVVYDVRVGVDADEIKFNSFFATPFSDQFQKIAAAASEISNGESRM